MVWGLLLTFGTIIAQVIFFQIICRYETSFQPKNIGIYFVY